ncbi:MAG TPA: hypothetical protein PKM73_00480 [Verrucomicrobiota bacterium]|nr:hypothetical protein [Verrucomicrobiota bacterium]HNU49518.1 hypothetical protein [Verrucomicrobiota bacterium]
MKSLRTVLGQPSWRLASKEVEVFVTQTGGHTGPVTFDRSGRCLQPLAVAPWAEEECDPGTPAILKVLRGDFFCLPFGGNETVADGERHPVHGETANSVWTLESLEAGQGTARLHASLKTKVRRGQVDKHLLLVDGHDAVYSRHVISGMRGAMCFGHHAMVRFPDRPGSGVVSTSPFVYGQVFPEPTERPERRGYSMLKPGAEFTTLEEVPTLFGASTDLSRYPARRGYEDIVMIVSDPDVPFAWTAVTFPRERYAWFALKDPRVLRSTVFWLSNGGRHYPPWNGRHVNVLGLEEVTSNFHYGLAESVRINPLSRRGYATSHLLGPESPTTIPYIQAVASLPAGFDRVAGIEVRTDSTEGVVLRSASGKAVPVPLRLGFLRGEGR